LLSPEYFGNHRDSLVYKQLSTYCVPNMSLIHLSGTSAPVFT